MAPVEFQLLGPPAIRVNGARIAGLPAKLEALLFFTAVAPRTVSRSVLAGLLWPDRNEQEARMNLRAALAKLPPALESAVTVTRDWVALETGGIEVDARRFDAVLLTLGAGLAAQERLRALREGLSAYRGEFLADFRVGQAPEFEAWREGERARLRQGAVRLATEILSLERASGLDADAAQTARRILQLAPGHDAALCALMEALDRAGQRNAAVEEFERHRKLWHEELGISPAPETVRVAERILSGEPAAAAAPAAPATAAPAQVFGRDAEFALLSQLLEPGEPRIVSITGMGGVGKTRLGQALLAELKPRFAQGVLLVSTGALRSGANVAPALAKALGLQARGNPAAAIEEFLREKSMLVMFDSFEGLIGTEAVDLLLRIAHAAPAVRLLVTSRESLGVAEEAVVVLEGLDHPNDAGAADWRDYPAVQLFIQRASRGYVRFDAERERDGIVALCRAMQGIPLAIELAASLARNMPCVEIARAVERDLRALAQDDAALSPRHRSLAGVLDTTFAQLAADLQEGLARLSIFRGPFRADAALDVAGCSLRQLSGLIEKSLLRRDVATGYVLHDVVRQFAGTRLAALGIDAEALRERHGRYFATLLATNAEVLRRGTNRALEAELWNQLPDLLEASTWSSLHAEVGLASRAMEAFYGLHESAGDDASIELIFREATARLAGVARDRRVLLARATCYLGWAYAQMSRVDESYPTLERALALARECGDAEVVSAILRGMGLVRAQQGQSAEGMRVLEECMAVTRTLNDALKEMNTLNVMGLVASGLGNGHGQREHFERVIELARSNDYPRGEIVARINLGESLMAEARLDESQAHFEAALALLDRAPSRRARVMSLMNLGQIAQLRRDPAASRRLLADTEGYILEGGERRYDAFLHAARAEIEAMERNWPGVAQAGARMAETADSIGWGWAAGFGAEYLVQARVMSGDREGALEALIDLFRRARSADFSVHHAGCALEAARWVLAFGNDADARAEAARCVVAMATAPEVDYWVVLRARELRDAHGLHAAAGAARDARQWLDAMEGLVPRATIAA